MIRGSADMKFVKAVLISAVALSLAGCSTLASHLAKREESGVVIARRAQIRSSTAVVAADLLEVSRGDHLDILDSDTMEGERWLRVRAHDEANTEGWIEARNVMPDDMLERSRKLADEDKGIQPQATGQLRASTNLRLVPDRSRDDNIIMKLDSGSNFDIVGWKRVSKPKASETTESDDMPKAGSVQQNSNKGRRDTDTPKMPEEANELWYKVHLSRSISPAPAGWVYGKQVELTVPSDIIFYRTGREFVAWHRLDADAPADTAAPAGKDAGGDARPGSWVILEKSSSDEPHKINEPDFDRVFVLGYNAETQEHYTAYRGPDIKGYLPLRVDGQGPNKTFSVRMQDPDGQIQEAQFKVSTGSEGLLKVTPPETPKRKKK